jgi:hypothetical protein
MKNSFITQPYNDDFLFALKNLHKALFFIINLVYNISGQKRKKGAETRFMVERIGRAWSVFLLMAGIPCVSTC